MPSRLKTRLSYSRSRATTGSLHTSACMDEVTQGEGRGKPAASLPCLIMRSSYSGGDTVYVGVSLDGHTQSTVTQTPSQEAAIARLAEASALQRISASGGVLSEAGHSGGITRTCTITSRESESTTPLQVAPVPSRYSKKAVYLRVRPRRVTGRISMHGW